MEPTFSASARIDDRHCCYYLALPQHAYHAGPHNKTTTIESPTGVRLHLQSGINSSAHCCQKWGGNIVITTLPLALPLTGTASILDALTSLSPEERHHATASCDYGKRNPCLACFG